MGLYECALGSGFVLALVWSIVLSLQRNALRKRSEQNIRHVLGRIQRMEHDSGERPNNPPNY
jgi:hypothetical protein